MNQRPQESPRAVVCRPQRGPRLGGPFINDRMGAALISSAQQRTRTEVQGSIAGLRSRKPLPGRVDSSSPHRPRNRGEAALLTGSVDMRTHAFAILNS